MLGHEQVSPCEHQRNIIDMGFRSRKSTRVLLLTARHKALRLALSRQHQHWTVDDWKHIAWSEESRSRLNRSDGRVWVWRQPHEIMDPTCQQGTAQAGGGFGMDSRCQLPPALLQTLIESLSLRVAALLRARGDPTRY
ncbi:HTH_Tnp_Tc3_2 domain-containing protein [Trichonephila clavipes]|nr:HTH_Tnp_Tc3_2 domain-containing protein [Trichonephila clavipes]